MISEINEFIDTYSDDIISLAEARRVLLTHPIENHSEEAVNASFCRMFAVIMVGSIENMLEVWRDKDKHKILEEYFQVSDVNGNYVSNEVKVGSLLKAFQGKGIEVDSNVFAEYLAIKYLRNVIVHSNWGRDSEFWEKKQKQWIEDFGFPIDTRLLTEKHWEKMQYVNEKMMLYIALTEYEAPFGKSLSKMLNIEDDHFDKLDLGLVRKEHIPQMFWNNLEKIHDCLSKVIFQHEDLRLYNWTDLNQKKLFYIDLRKAVKNGFSPLLKYKGLANDALESWREYWYLTFEQAFITQSDLEIAKETFLKLHKKTDNNYLTEEQINTGLIIGKEAYKHTKSTATELLVIQLPIIDPDTSHTYKIEGEKALLAMEVSNYYHTFIEEKDINKKLAFYREMLELDGFQ